MKTNKTVIVNQMPLAERIVGSLFTYSMLLLCIYVSQGSTWWTFFTGTLFIVSMAIYLLARVKQDTVTINSKDEAMKWAQSFPEE